MSDIAAVIAVVVFSSSAVYVGRFTVGACCLTSTKHLGLN
jgi:hypothetical protein